jgi:cephalosporin hydroxylase
MSKIQQFAEEREQRIRDQLGNAALRGTAQAFLVESIKSQYSYNFSWLSRPIIQYPQDIVAFQEVVWRVRPDLIIETGIAHGGSLVLSASLLALLEYTDAIVAGTTLDPSKPTRRVLGVDIDIRAHNREALDAHPLRNRIDMIQGSSVAPETVRQVRNVVREGQTVLVCLDSNHTHEHVLRELEAYAPLVSRGSYCVVFDTMVEDVPKDLYPDRPWGPGNSPKSAVHAYLDGLGKAPATGDDGAPLQFDVDEAMDGKLLVSVAPSGYLRRR